MMVDPGPPDLTKYAPMVGFLRVASMGIGSTPRVAGLGGFLLAGCPVHTFNSFVRYLGCQTSIFMLKDTYLSVHGVVSPLPRGG